MTVANLSRGVNMWKPVTRIIATTVLLLLGTAVPAEQNTAVRVVGNHAPPYRIFGENSYSGIYFDTINEIASRLGLEVHFDQVSFAEALDKMRSGEADIMLGPNRNASRTKYMVYTAAIFPREDKAFYVHQASGVIAVYRDLSWRKILVQKGKVYFSRFDQDRRLDKIVAADQGELIEKIKSCLECVVIMPEREGDYLFKTLGIDLKKSPYKVHGKVSYLTISRKSRFMDLQGKIESAMDAIKADGTYQRILNRYSR
ncbi:MAG: transporter substrate-binding domain-containing protein [Sedimenticola sp.]